jgi:glycosyltransferase involved in cell wall biosynthesis
LSFLTDDDVKAAHRNASRADFPSLAELPPDVKIIGVFGFISPYKGTTTAIRALRYLPENYHLAIFGGVHPASIQINKEIDPYMQTVVEEVCGGEAPRQFLAPTDETGAAANAVPRSQAVRSNISDRVHFMGALDDEAFIKGMCLCHTTVFPYLEVGQTSSGPISMAIELGCRVVAARNHAFMQLAKYHPARFDFFEIGNHCELAERVLHPHTQPGSPPTHSWRSNVDVYVEANAAGSPVAGGR